jgi:hypothetical protein
VPPAAPEKVLVTRDGHVVALIMPFDDDDPEWYASERDPVFLASITRARRQVREGGTVTYEAPKRSLR